MRATETTDASVTDATAAKSQRAVHPVIVLAGIVLSVLLAGCAATPPGTLDSIQQMYTHAEGVSVTQLQERVARGAAMLDWAAELKLTGPFSYEETQKAYQDAVAARVAGTTTGTDVYGARMNSVWDFYVDEIQGVEQEIQHTLQNELALDQVQEYYTGHPELFRQQDPMTVQVTEWANGRAGLTREVSLDATNVRLVQEADDALISAALALKVGERVTVERGDGNFAQVLCLSRGDGGLEPFDDVVQAAASALARELFDSELRRRSA